MGVIAKLRKFCNYPLRMYKKIFLFLNCFRKYKNLCKARFKTNRVLNGLIEYKILEGYIMKKIICLSVFLAACGMLFAQNYQAVIKDFTGKVEIKNAGDNAWKEAKKGDVLQKNTLISTGFKSTAILTIGNSTLTVKPLTRLSLEEIARADNAEEVKVYLSAGRVRADVTPPAGGRTDFSVRSPSATASVRGTSFEFDSVSLKVIGGKVNFAGRSGKSMDVSAGETSQVSDSGGAASAPQETVATAAPAMPVGVSQWNSPVSGNNKASSSNETIHISIGW